MFFGDHQTFCIQSDIAELSSDKDLAFGDISFWVAGHQIGDSALIVILNTPARLLQSSLRDSKLRKYSEDLNQLSDQEIFGFISNKIYGESLLMEDSIRYEKYQLCPGFSESFDGENMYLIESEQEELFLWKDAVSGSIESKRLPKSSYASSVSLFVNWLERQIRTPID